MVCAGRIKENKLYASNLFFEKVKTIIVNQVKKISN